MVWVSRDGLTKRCFFLAETLSKLCQPWLRLVTAPGWALIPLWIKAPLSWLKKRCCNFLLASSHYTQKSTSRQLRIWASKKELDWCVPCLPATKPSSSNYQIQLFTTAIPVIWYLVYKMWYLSTKSGSYFGPKKRPQDNSEGESSTKKPTRTAERIHAAWNIVIREEVCETRRGAGHLTWTFLI